MKVAVLCGGRSHERAVSLRSGARVAETLRDIGHDVDVVDVGPDAARRLRDAGYDVAFVALHGRGGDDGAIQSVCELVGLGYTGTRSDACEATFDKARAKRALVAAGVPTPEFVVLAETALEEYGAAEALDGARSQVGFPLVVKPARGGSSLGVRFVDDDGDLPRALIGAMSYDRTVVIERHVTGRELAVTVVGSGADAREPRVLPAVEITPRHADWFDYESRYEHGETEFTCPPAGFDDALLARVEQVAVDAWRTLGCSGYARVDMIVDGDGTPWVLELSVVPGLTETSIVPLACTAAGLGFDELLAGLLADAVARD